MAGSRQSMPLRVLVNSRSVRSGGSIDLRKADGLFACGAGFPDDAQLVATRSARLTQSG